MYITINYFTITKSCRVAVRTRSKSMRFDQIVHKQSKRVKNNYLNDVVKKRSNVPIK